MLVLVVIGLVRVFSWEVRYFVVICLFIWLVLFGWMMCLWELEDRVIGMREFLLRRRNFFLMLKCVM